jgi:hypothetical protein
LLVALKSHKAFRLCFAMARLFLLGFACLVFHSTLWMTHGVQSDDACPNTDVETQDDNSLLQTYTRHQQSVASLQRSKKGASGKVDEGDGGLRNDVVKGSEELELIEAARANETYNPCAACINTKHDGVCVPFPNPRFPGICSNPSGTNACTKGDQGGPWYACPASCSDPPSCAFCINPKKNGACFSNPRAPAPGACTNTPARNQVWI